MWTLGCIRSDRVSASHGCGFSRWHLHRRGHLGRSILSHCRDTRPEKRSAILVSCRPNRSGRLECSAMKNKHVWTDRFIGICLFVATFAAATMTDRAGMPQRWHAAIVGILLPFSSIISIKRTSWPRPTFWTSLGGCLVLNFLLIASFFEFVLRSVRVFGWIWWVPVAFVQTLGMLYLQPKLERTLRAR